MTQDHNELEIDNLPNRLTMFRILLVPAIIGCLLAQKFTPALSETLGIIAAVIFVIASITDYVDGYIARKRNIVTLFGSFLDPIADKFLTVSTLIMLEALGKIHVVIVIILVLREIYITSLRLLATSQDIVVSVNNNGKWKTATQMIGIPFLLLSGSPFDLPVEIIGKSFIIISALLSIYSSAQYSLGLLKKLKLKRQMKKELK